MILIALAAILEAIFLRIVLPGDLRPRIVEAIGLLLLSGLFYLVCVYIILRRGPRQAKPPAPPRRGDGLRDRWGRRFRLPGPLGRLIPSLAKRPRPPFRPGLIVAAAIVFRLTFWPLYPALSDDVFRYLWEGKLQAAGGNPYAARPNDPAWKSLRDESFASTPGRDFRAVYGPLVEGIESITW